jgi:diphosphomevalonate decarboxylase
MTEMTHINEKTSFTASAPSNIAFIKYWGKRDPELQWPANDSLSMTLKESRTITTARLSPQTYDTFSFEGRTLNSSQHPDHKIFRHLDRMRALTGISARLDIESQNTFPTGCGIASSASGFAALTIASAAALTGEDSLDGLATRGLGRSVLADCARQGSGSAGRSLFDGFVAWTAGKQPSEQKITREHPVNHWELADVIVVLSDLEKSVSSSQAHLAAWASPLFSPRLSGLSERLTNVRLALQNKDLRLLGSLIETDALEMHAVAMTGEPRVCYLSSDSQNFITWVRDERLAGRLDAWFTIDAGPNVHLICAADDASRISQHIKKHWPRAKVISDRVGSGPTLCRGTREAKFD